MDSIFEFYSFPKLMIALKKKHKQSDIARKLGLSPQKVNQVFNFKQHLVYPQISTWRKALDFRRLEGDYFELLALIFAFRHNIEAKQQVMLKRAFHLAGRLEEKLNPEGDVAGSLIYWLDPLVPVLRNMVELNDFPLVDAEIPAYVTERITFVGALGNIQKTILSRVEITWSFLRRIKALVPAGPNGRFVKADSNIFSRVQIGPDQDLKDIQSVILLLNQLITYHDFSREAGGPNILGDKLATFSISSKALELLDKLSRDFLFGDILAKLNFLCNRDDLARLETKDPAYYAKVIAFRTRLVSQGYDIPECGDTDTDTTIQVLLAARRLTK